jgi:glycosyltransferase involved in cell wall biosynthesis
MKNILYIHAGAEMYGADKILLETVEGINKEEFTPIVVLPTDGILRKKLEQNDIETHVIDYPILRRKYFNVKGIINYVRSYRKKSQDIVNLLEDKKIDIIHANTTAVLEGIYLKYKLHAKLIWHVHEIITTPKFMNVIISFLLGRFADEIITVSKAVKSNLVKTHLVSSDKITVLYNGISNVDLKSVKTDYLYKEFNISNKNKIIGMIGRINAWKGQEDYIKAVVPILKDNRDVHAFVVGGVFNGEEWRKDNLKKIIDKTEVSGQIHLVDFRNDAVHLLKMFDLFVLPSTRPDPFPTVVLEAMSVGKAVVAYKHGGVLEMIEEKESGLFANVNEVDDLSKKISLLIEDDVLLEKMGKSALNRQRNLFNKKQFIQNMEKIYLGE